MKTSELTGAALDWAVAQCECVEFDIDAGALVIDGADYYCPSTDWAQGGPIIERERIDIEHFALPERGWMAGIINKAQEYGPTPLIAAMRCYVASKLGDEVEVPDEITV